MTDTPPPTRPDSLGDMVDAVAQAVARVEPIVLRPTVVGRLVLGIPVIPVGAAIALSSPAVAAVVGVGYVVTWILIGRRRVVVDHDGVSWRGVGGSGRLGWDDVTHYRYWSGGFFHTHGDLRRRLVDQASVVGARHHLVLESERGGVVIDSSLAGAERAVGRALAVLHPRFRARGSLDLAPFTVDDDGLGHARHGKLAWTELEKVTLSNQLPPQLRVIKRGKALAWASEKFGHIHNGMLLLEELADRGVILDPGHQALLTETLLTALTRSRALPTATVVKRPRP